MHLTCQDQLTGDWLNKTMMLTVVAGRGRRGTCTPGGIVQGRHLEGRKYGILKFGCFWRIGVCIADSDNLHPLTLLSFGNTPTVSASRPYTKQCVHQETYTADLTESAVKL